MRAVTYDISPPRWIACKIASLAWRGVYLSRLSTLRMREIPEPKLPGPDWVKLRTIYGGVCGTDLALITSRNHPNTTLQQYAAFPAVLGHENVATIDAIGEDVVNWKVGDRVCVDPALGCRGRGIDPPCPNCAAGLDSICEAPPDDRSPPRALLGLNRMTLGSWAPYFLAHRSQLHRVPVDVSNEIAILIDPIASAAHAVLRRPPQADEKILVQGAGIVALGVIASIRALGHDHRVVAIVRNSSQADLAKRMGATDCIIASRNQKKRDRYDAMAHETGGTRVEGRMGNQSMIGGCDLIYDCSGQGIGLSDALQWTRSRGTVVVVGTTGIAMTDTTPVWFSEVNVLGANGRQFESIDGERKHTYDVVFDWIRGGKIDLSALPTACVPLSDYRRGLAMMIQRPRANVVKVYFRPDE